MKQPKLFLIHGLFMHGSVMEVMKRRLQALGYDVFVFSYKSVSRSFEENTKELVRFVGAHTEQGDICHFVGHSLGGLLIRTAYALEPSIISGRIVTLGTPHQGSSVARRVAEDIYHGIIGGAYKGALDGCLPKWTGDVELGSIAGTKCIGIGQLYRDLECPNDGTVSVSETQLEHQTDSVEVSLSHTALVYSKRVIHHTDYFLRHGHFAQTRNIS